MFEEVRQSVINHRTKKNIRNKWLKWLIDSFGNILFSMNLTRKWFLIIELNDCHVTNDQILQAWRQGLVIVTNTWQSHTFYTPEINHCGDKETHRNSTLNCPSELPLFWHKILTQIDIPRGCVLLTSSWQEAEGDWCSVNRWECDTGVKHKEAKVDCVSITF